VSVHTHTHTLVMEKTAGTTEDRTTRTITASQTTHFSRSPYQWIFTYKIIQ